MIFVATNGITFILQTLSLSPLLYPLQTLSLTVDTMSEISSLHDGGDPRNRGRSRPPNLNTVYDDENMSTISSVSQNMRRDEPRRDAGPNRGRARSMENLDDLGRNYRDHDYPPRDRGGRRG